MQHKVLILVMATPDGWFSFPSRVKVNMGWAHRPTAVSNGELHAVERGGARWAHRGGARWVAVELGERGGTRWDAVGRGAARWGNGHRGGKGSPRWNRSSRWITTLACTRFPIQMKVSMLNLVTGGQNFHDIVSHNKWQLWCAHKCLIRLKYWFKPLFAIPLKPKSGPPQFFVEPGWTPAQNVGSFGPLVSDPGCATMRQTPTLLSQACKR